LDDRKDIWFMKSPISVMHGSFLLEQVTGGGGLCRKRLLKDSNITLVNAEIIVTVTGIAPQYCVK